MGLFEHKRILQFLSPTFKSEDSVKSAWLPDSGFYPEISGIFRAVGIFLGIKIWAKNLGIKCQINVILEFSIYETIQIK